MDNKIKNVAQDVQKRIVSLEKGKASELNAIQLKIDESKKSAVAAQRAMATATAATDLKGYQKAKAENGDALDALEMYQKRYAQLKENDFVTERESDSVIDSLLKYEEDLSAEYRENVLEPLTDLKAIHDAYEAAIKETEDVIRAWTNRIHANYRSETTTYADGSNRSKTPVPVRNTPYFGCKESLTIGNFLQKTGSDK